MNTSGALVTVIVYVLVVAFSAVTSMVIVLVPSVKAIVPDADPLTTVVPFTVMIPLAWVLVGVTVIVLILFATSAV